MRRKLVITIDTDETSENTGFGELMDNLQYSSPGKAGTSGLHSRLPRGVRPRLEGKPRTPLSSRVATRVSWRRPGVAKYIFFKKVNCRCN